MQSSDDIVIKEGGGIVVKSYGYGNSISILRHVLNWTIVQSLLNLVCNRNGFEI